MKHRSFVLNVSIALVLLCLMAGFYLVHPDGKVYAATHSSYAVIIPQVVRVRPDSVVSPNTLPCRSHLYLTSVQSDFQSVNAPAMAITTTTAYLYGIYTYLPQYGEYNFCGQVVTRVGAQGGSDGTVSSSLFTSAGSTGASFYYNGNGSYQVSGYSSVENASCGTIELAIGGSAAGSSYACG